MAKTRLQVPYATVKIKVGKPPSYYGLYLSHDLFKRIVARHLAHLHLAEVTVNGIRTIEPFKVEWGVPKYVHMFRKNLANSSKSDH